jgi:replicative DNA helicase
MIDPLQRGLPSDVETEKLVLGAVMIDPEAWLAVAETLRMEHFTLEDHRRIWKACEAVFHREGMVDRASVAIELGPDLQPMGGISRLMALDQDMPQIVNLGAYARRLIGVSAKREALSCLVRLHDAVHAADEETIVPMLDRLTEALTSKQDRREWLSPKEIVDRAGGIDKLMGSAYSRDGIAPPWDSMRAVVPAFSPGQLVLVAARPGVGKTIMLAHLMEAAVAQQRPARMVSLEMLAQDIITRMACARAGVSLGRILHGSADIGERRAFQFAVGEIYAMQIKIRDGSQFTVPGLAASIRREGGRVKAVFVDYIGLMEGPGRTPYERITNISRGLKRLAIEQQVCVVAAAQINRQGPAENRAPELHDLRDSGALEQDADTVLMLHELNEEGDRGRRVDVHIRKQRRGPLGRVSMWRQGKYSRFEEA